MGAFHGTDEFHFGRGTASIIETARGRFTLRLDDFSVRNGPDLFVYLSPAADDYAKGALEVPAVPIYVQETIEPQRVVEDVRARLLSLARDR